METPSGSSTNKMIYIHPVRHAVSAAYKPVVAVLL
jgi:hypothetical protein